MSTVDVSKNTISGVGRKYLRLHRAANVGPVRLKSLREHFGSVEAILAASISELQRVEGIGPASAEGVMRSRCDEAVEREIERAAELGLQIVSVEDPDYPQSLLHITDPPTCLYIRGRIEPADAVGVAIVGTRRCSHYGREQALRFGESLAAAGFTIVSGLARGIDGYAHRGALRAGGRTIAVLGNGLASIYPEEHVELAEQIEKAGAVVSELPIDTGPEAKNFPGRNRIIIGLSLGVLVIEAGTRSGALITARLANEYNREVFALPGRIDHPQQTAGSNALIRDGGAKLVTCLEDVLDELGDVGQIMSRPEVQSSKFEVENQYRDREQAGGGDGDQGIKGGKDQGSESAIGNPDPIDNRQSTMRSSLNRCEQAVHAVIAEGTEDVELICQRSGIDAAGVGSVLTSLQLRGLIRQLPGNRFVVRSSGSRHVPA